MDYQTVLNAFLQSFLNIILPVLFAAIAGWVVVQIRAGLAKLKVVHPDEYYWLDWLAQTAVNAAEQAKLGGLIQNKKNYAIEIMTAYLKKYGVVLDISVIEASIEAAVWTEINKDNPAKNPSAEPCK